jgi:hypothetical protein
VDDVMTDKDLKTIWDQVNLAVGEDGGATDDADDFLQIHEFMEALIRIAFKRYHDDNDVPPPSSGALTPKGDGALTPYECLLLLLEKHSVLRLATKEEPGSFKAEVQAAEVQEVVTRYGERLKAAFEFFAAGGAAGDGGESADTMNVGEFFDVRQGGGCWVMRQMLRACQCLDNWLTMDTVSAIFENVQEEEEEAILRGEEPSGEVGSGGGREEGRGEGSLRHLKGV